MAKKFELPELPYDYDALEPVISAEIMELHHKKHHNGYVTNLNTALEKYADAEAKGDLEGMTATLQAIKFNGGGHINHSIFWTNLAPQKSGGGEIHPGALQEALTKFFGSVEGFIERFNSRTAAIQGSGWGWLAYSPEQKNLLVTTTANQDPLNVTGMIPLLGVDVWEHAYYIDYKNVRPDYLKNIWKLVNWRNVEERYLKAIG